VLKQHKLHVISIAIGAAYGLLMRGIFQLTSRPNWSNRSFFVIPVYVMSAAFVLVVPYCMGYLTIAIRAREGRVWYAARIFAPWLVVALALLGCALAAWEGIICIVMMTPIALVLGSLGGLTAGYVVNPSRPRFSLMSMLVVALLPFVVGWTEPRVPPRHIRTVESDVLIHASPQSIWQNIERVRPISYDELPRSWNRGIGFPESTYWSRKVTVKRACF
jgi:hypothetical protein